MIVFTISVIFLLEIWIFLLISRRVEYYNPVLFFVALPMFYANSLFLDYLISSRGFLELQVMEPTLSVYSFNYLIIVLLTFFYIVGVYASTFMKGRRFNVLTAQKKSQILEFDVKNMYSWLKIFFIFMSLVYILLVISQIYGMGRDEIKSLATPFRAISTQTAFIFLCFSLMYKWKFRSLNIIILVILLTYSILSFERENILLVIFSLIVNRPLLKLSLPHIFAGVLLFGLMLYYKTIVWSVIYYIDGADIDYIFNNLSAQSVRLTHIDPAASLLMQSDFLDNGDHYINYYGSYIVNVIMQVLRMFIDVDWLSLGEFSTQYYTNGKMGVAFSMIIESMLNFWYFGPFIVGLVITKFFYKTEKIAGIYYKLHYFIWFLFMLKFVRTEFAVVLKLYMLPAIIAYIAFVWVSKKINHMPGHSKC